MPVDQLERCRVRRVEWLWLGAAVLLGGVLRLSFLGRIAVEHFDEGVYSSNLWFETGSGYPARYLYGPPLLPMAIEWVMIVVSLCGFSPTGFVPAIPSLIAGLATIPSAWWICRRWFGPSAGIVTAWLIAASDFHSSYSRAALTDVPVCLLILWAVYFGSQGLRSGTPRDLTFSGLFTGLAWATKYSGWLPLAITLTGGAAWQLTMTRQERRLATTGLRWLIVAGVACAVWSPVLIGLQKHGGYAEVLANHRQYVVGANGWSRAAIRQLTNAGLYEDWVGAFDEVLMVATAGPTDPKPTLVGNPPSAESHTVMAIDLVGPVQINPANGAAEPSDSHSPASYLGQAMVVATPLLLLLVSGAGCTGWIAWRWRTSDSLAGWLLVAWICGLSVSIPSYHPYPRLMLPWLIAVWMGTGLAVESLVGSRLLRTVSRPAASRCWTPQWIEMVIAGWLLVCSTTRCGLGTAHAWQDRSGIAREISSAASEIKAITKRAGFPEDEAIIYVFGEPAVVFALKGNRLDAVGPVQDFSFLAGPRSRPTFFIHAGRATRSAEFRKEWDNRRSEFELVTTLTVRLSHLVVLDEEDNFTVLNCRLKLGEPFRISRVR